MPPLWCAGLVCWLQRRGILSSHACGPHMGPYYLGRSQVDVGLIHILQRQLDPSVAPVPDIVGPGTDHQLLVPSRHSAALLCMPLFRSAHPRLTVGVSPWSSRSPPAIRPSLFPCPTPHYHPSILSPNLSPVVPSLSPPSPSYPTTFASRLFSTRVPGEVAVVFRFPCLLHTGPWPGYISISL